MSEEKCLHCENTAHVRGTCHSHYRSLLNMVKTGKATDEEMVAANMWKAAGPRGSTHLSLGLSRKLEQFRAKKPAKN